jgi:hypothetical protein
MSGHSVLGWLGVAIGGLQCVAAIRGHRAAGKGGVLLGLGLMSVGASQLLRDSAPAWRVGSLGLMAVLVIAQAATRRREAPREFLILSSLMVICLAFGVLFALGYSDHPLVDRAFVLVFGAAFVALVLWLVFTVLRSVIGAFRPIARRPGD